MPTVALVSILPITPGTTVAVVVLAVKVSVLTVGVAAPITKIVFTVLQLLLPAVSHTL